MPNKSFLLDDDLSVTVYKRRASRSLRLSIAPDGEVRVSIPTWAAYRAGVNFAASRLAWIRAQQPPRQLLASGQAIGKAHHLLFVPVAEASRPSSRVSDTTVLVRYPSELTVTNPAVQRAAKAACVRALRAQAEQLLPQRLAGLATGYNFTYAGVSIKQLTGRWGSCDQAGHIVLNLFLMQLPWELIDYVLLHELTHTVVLKHGPAFWQSLETVLPEFAQRRTSIRNYHPVLAGVA